MTNCTGNDTDALDSTLAGGAGRREITVCWRERTRKKKRKGGERQRAERTTETVWQSGWENDRHCCDSFSSSAITALLHGVCVCVRARASACMPLSFSRLSTCLPASFDLSLVRVTITHTCTGRGRLFHLELCSKFSTLYVKTAWWKHTSHLYKQRLLSRVYVCVWKKKPVCALWLSAACH